MPRILLRPVGVRSKPKPLWPSREALYTDLGLFILVISGLYSVSIIGALPGCEVILLPALPVLLIAKGKRAFQHQYLWFLVLVTCWLLGTLIADAYNDMGIYNRAKGTSRVIFFALDFMALAVLINEKTRRIVVFALSYAGVLLFGSFKFNSDIQLQWKFGISQGSGVLAMLVSSYFFKKEKYWVCFWISLGWAALNLYYGFRSQLAIHFVAAALTLPLFGQARKLRSGVAREEKGGRVILTLLLAAAAAYGANAAIKYAARGGIFDESTRGKFESQANGDYGVLVGGRPETPVAIRAIEDSPIIGHGSFADGTKYLQMKQDLQYEHGYSDTDTPEEVQFTTIPTHSHLTLAWVESGVLGGVCWIYILLLTLRAALKLNFLHSALAPYYSYALAGFLWDILYSPFGSVNRIWAAFYILMSYHILNEAAAKALGVREQKLIHSHGPLRISLRRLSSTRALP